MKKQKKEMIPERVNFLLESLALMNPEQLWMKFFLEPTIALMKSYSKNPFPFDFKCERIASSLATEKNDLMVEFGWNPQTFSDSEKLLNTIQREVIVEYASVAVASFLVTQIENCTITEITMRGDKADYFLNNKRLMLEVSGTENAKQLTSRHKQKRKQLLENPYQLGGYVVVCCFTNHRGYFSFHPLSRKEGD